VHLTCKMDKGFFIDDAEQWTCYRRNYFQITASCSIEGHTDGILYGLQLSEDKPLLPVQQFYLRLESSSVFLETHNMIKPVALTQMTAKRDKGPQREPPLLAIIPIDVKEQNKVCTFDRLQFKTATANNGKRKATQQYFRLRVELLVELSDGSRHVVSECYSLPVIVRGRSPGHYSAEDKQKQQQQQQQQPIRFPYSPQPHHSQQMMSPSHSQHAMAAFSNFHGRSQSANDCDAYHR
ncbi:hypothetical protein BDF20DRAFT_808349, partial [Mycotypha africana]|uniref:uncharacterized protein n=1 Tax=Mycotypha africana TaxID=64632 RepID=UPI002300FC5E